MEKPFAFREIAMPHPNPRNEYVTYGRRLQPEMNFESDGLERLYLDHRKGLIETAIEECAEYLDADDWMDEDVFPCVREMTGEWRLSMCGARAVRSWPRSTSIFWAAAPRDPCRGRKMTTWVSRRCSSTTPTGGNLALTA